jgi:hypothetical protein
MANVVLRLPKSMISVVLNVTAGSSSSLGGFTDVLTVGGS